MKMVRTIQILFLSFLLFTCTNAQGQQSTNAINFKSGYSLLQDTISINVKGEMTHALKFKDKYYVLFEQHVPAYGGDGKRTLYILSNGVVAAFIDCPKEMEAVYLDFYVKNDSIILKPYMQNHGYYFNPANYTWNKIKETDDLIYEDDDFYVYSLSFGEWGGKTWFKDKKSGSEYVVECTTPLVNKMGTTYYLTNSFQVLKIKNPLELTKCGSDVTYENIQKTGKYHSWYSKPKGYQIIYKKGAADDFDFSNSPRIVSSFVSNDELIHIYETNTASYLSKIVKGHIQPFEKIFANTTFYNGHFSYRCRNLRNTNELLKFKTKNEQVFGLATIVADKIFVTYLVNEAELKPQLIGREKSNEILKKRLKTIMAGFKNLTLTDIEAKENKWRTFDISPNHKIGIGDSWNPNNHVIDTNRSYLVAEDSIFSNAIMYYATNQANLVRAVTIDWYKSRSGGFIAENKNVESKTFLSRFEELRAILVKELGQPSSTTKNASIISLTWTVQNEIIVEIELQRLANYNNICLVIYEKDK